MPSLHRQQLRRLQLRHRILFGQQRDQRSQLVAHLTPVHDHVDGAVFEQELGTLESIRQRFAHGLLNHARTGKTDQRAGLGDNHVTEESITGRNSAHGRVGQHRNKR